MTQPSGTWYIADAVFRDEREYYDKAGHSEQPFDKRLVTYSQLPDRELPGTLYLPRVQDEARAPAIVWVHGGGWNQGDRGQFAIHSAYMAAASGIASLCVTYRLSGDAAWPACLEDAKCGIRWLRAHAGEFGIDPERIAVGGSSAGAHIAAMASVTGGGKQYTPAGGCEHQSDAVKASIFYNGIFDLPARDGESLATASLVKLFGATPAEAPSLYREASPIHYVSAGTPPAFLPHGASDTTISSIQSIRFADKLMSAGVEGEVMIVPNTGHGELNNTTNFEPVLLKALAFLGRHL